MWLASKNVSTFTVKSLRHLYALMRVGSPAHPSYAITPTTLGASCAMGPDMRVNTGICGFFEVKFRAGQGRTYTAYKPFACHLYSNSNWVWQAIISPVFIELLFKAQP